MTPPPFGLRMAPDLHAAIKQMAAANNRSMNAEIVARLESTFRDDNALADIVKTAMREVLSERSNDQA